jgi:DNA-binding MarR family transcriptional regulator
MQYLTDNQKKVLSEIKKSPSATYREIADKCGYKYCGSVVSVVKALCKKGVLEEKKKKPEWVVKVKSKQQ